MRASSLLLSAAPRDSHVCPTLYLFFVWETKSHAGVRTVLDGLEEREGAAERDGAAELEGGNVTCSRRGGC
jgi:hypothetical protein